ncbi:hypothetical protein H072_11072 [Dactylellina haptotyla CBS 200.50]|uniref:Uncharacterized protein n=1 Tax=Dactylellina haptotyla (strain CBS 200.50) TaxID=1284197 RepID=S8BJS4_DACHA|nr:hypothetical protein H072_11072 [Dactylellina haptotyla CBS 200.50]
MQLLTTSIEIAAAPNVVREKFLDFSQLPNYHKNGFFKSIGPAVKGEPYEPGLKMRNELKVMVIEPTLLENSPKCFSWMGNGLLGTFNGEHRFRFEPSTTTPGGTTFIHEEIFTGALSLLMGENLAARAAGLKKTTKEGFEGFNVDLKKWCESS